MAERVEQEEICVICCYSSDYFCLGQCDHPVCFECGTRLRVLCQSNECSICRSQLSEVYVVNGVNKTFASIDISKFKCYDGLSKEYGFKFENEEAYSAVNDILAHVCTICKNEPSFRSLELLSEHMRRTHQLFYCDICVEFLKLFSWERKCYNRTELARHRRNGDPDDRSHTGHPLCQFCDERYLDDDILFRHLRRDHFFCHFCDADGKNKFYPDVERLKDHFREEHFLCEISQCKTEHMGVAFRNEIDLKAHKAAAHGKDIQKNELKKEMQVNVGFNFGPTPSRERYTKQTDRTMRRPHNAADAEVPPAAKMSDRAKPLKSADLTNTSQSPSSNETAGFSNTQISNNFQIQNEDFPSLFQNNRQNTVRKTFKTQSLANLVATNGPALNENFPSLNEAKKQTTTMYDSDNGVGRYRRDSHSASPKMSNKNRAGLHLVDDDEEFAVQAAKETKKQIAPQPPIQKITRETISRNPHLQQPVWGPMKSTAGYANEAEFPSLPSKSPKKSNKKNKAQATSSSTAYAQKVQTHVVKKEPEPPKLQMKLNQKDFPDLVCLPKTKARARLVAQNQQRPSIDEQVDIKSLVVSANTDHSQQIISDNYSHINSSLTAPPGLSKPIPPPGFEPVMNVPNSAASYAVESSYIKSKSFQARNRALFDLLSEKLQPERLNEFKVLSSMYRKGETPADSYYSGVKSLLGKKLFLQCFPELLCLLPDIKKQNSLLTERLSEDAAFGSSTAWKKNPLFDSIRICNVCSQIISNIDCSEHYSNHITNEEFPVLS